MLILEHQKKYIPGAMLLVPGRVKNSAKTMPQYSIEELIIKSSFLEKAPFSWISLSYSFGLNNNLKVKYHAIDKEIGDILISVELDIKILQWADIHNLDLLHDIFMMAALEALIQLGKKYKLPTGLLTEERKKYSEIPSTIEECKNYIRLVDD
jgi:hypothetical protein